MNKFTAAMTMAATRHHTYLKGKDYYLAGRVTILSKTDKRAEAVVTGTDEYQVQVSVNEYSELNYKCSCPVDTDRLGACKHVVATVLKLAGEGQKKTEKMVKEKAVVPEMTGEQAREFVRKMIQENPEWADEAGVFLQGQKETEITPTSYYERFVGELEGIDPDELLEEWYRENELGQYDEYGEWGEYDEEGDNQLARWVEEVTELLHKYVKYENYAEAVKIGAAGARALAKRVLDLSDGQGDLEDWFVGGINLLIEESAKLNKLYTDEQLAPARKLWEEVLESPGFDDHLGPVVQAVAEIWRREGDLSGLERLVKQYLPQYPPVAVGLLEHYLEQGMNDELLALSTKVLEEGRRSKYEEYWDLNNYFDKRELEVAVRRLRARAYERGGDMDAALVNAEELFLASHKIEDYGQLREMFLRQEQKEEFWQRMEKELGEWGVEAMFEVYKLEKEKERILWLLQKYPEVGCFPKMIRKVRDEYPEECFAAYRAKIEKLLIPTDTAKYANVAYQLAQMKGIGMEQQFESYRLVVRDKYKRRRRMMEALAKRGL